MARPSTPPTPPPVTEVSTRRRKEIQAFKLVANQERRPVNSLEGFNRSGEMSVLAADAAEVEVEEVEKVASARRTGSTNHL